jgi:hypothetical protein
MAQIIDLGKIRFNWAGTYDSGTSYSYNDLVKYGPNLYAFTALTSATGVVPTTTSTWAVVTQGIQYRGTYTSGTHYYVNDVVIDGQNTYITVTEHTASSNVALANANLNLIAQGQQGLPNQTGKQNQLLASDGTQALWTARPLLSKLDVGDSQGATAVSFENNAGLTNIISTFSATATDFAQFVVVNNGTGASVSTDVIVYPKDGTNSAGFIDMGITSNQFSALQYGITGPHDGYIFMSSPMPGVQSVISYSVSNGLATVNTSAPHGWSVGNAIIVQQVLTGINGKHVVQTVPNNSSITFTVSGVANATTTVLSVPGTVHKPTGNGNLVFATDATGLTNAIIFAAGGYDSGRTQMIITPDQQVAINISTASTSATTGALVVAGGIGVTGSSWTNGDLHVGGIVYSGDNTATSWGLTQLLTAPAAVFEVTSADNTYGQFALHNKSTSSSVDFIAYPDNGNDAHGWIDMGMTGSTFNSTTYGITGPNDGYLFVDAPTGSTGAGNLVLSTGNNGTANRIVFAAGGFVTGRTQMQIIPDQSVVINIATQSTSATTGALIVTGGVGITGNVNIAGNITFGGSGTNVSTANLAVNAPIVFTGSGSIVGTNDLGLVTEGKYSVGAYNSISNPYGIPGATIVNKQLTSNVATLVTYAAHPFIVGDSVTIASVDSVFNGTYTITVVPTSTSFSYAKTNADIASARIGDQTYSINQKALVSNVATLQTTANHTYTIGQTVVVSGVDSTFNGTYVITATTANSFSYAKTSINVSATTVSPVGTAVVNTSASTVVISSATRTRWSAWYKSAASVPTIGEQGTWNLVSNISTLPVNNINLAQATYGALDVQYDLIKVGGITIQGGLNSGNFTLVGNIQAPAWTTSGIRHIGNAFTATDATSTGTVSEAYTNSFGQTTVAALNTGVTYTNYATVSLAAPVAGTNVTITNAYSLISQGNTLTRGSATFSGATYFTNAVNSFTGATQFTGLVDVNGLRENFLTTSISGATSTFDCSQAGVFWVSSAPSGNQTYNFINVPNTGSGVNKIMAVDVFQQQGGTPYYPTTVTVNGSGVTIRWAGGLAPSLNAANGIDAFGFTFFLQGGTITCLATVSAGY